MNFASQLGNDDEEVETEDFEFNDEDNVYSRERLFSEPPCFVENADETMNIHRDSLSGCPLEEVPKNLTWENYSRKMSSDLVRKYLMARL